VRPDTQEALLFWEAAIPAAAAREFAGCTDAELRGRGGPPRYIGGPDGETWTRRDLFAWRLARRVPPLKPPDMHPDPLTRRVQPRLSKRPHPAVTENNSPAT
jgi:hypothetical protein